MGEQQIPAEDIKVWMDRFGGSIERLAIQYGCIREQAKRITEETFRSYDKKLCSQSDAKELQILLYQVALEKLESIPQTVPSEATFLPFEEDRQLHKKIIQLNRELKLSIILSIFHEMDDMDIAHLLGISEESVKDSIHQAYLRIADDSDHLRIAKQLEFLKLSYGRINPMFRKERVFLAREKEFEKMVKTKKLSKGMFPVLVCLLILLSLIVSSVVKSSEYQTKAAEKYLNRLQENFERDMTNRIAELGFPRPTEGDVPSNYLNNYGREVHVEFQSLMRRAEKELRESGTINRKSVKGQYAAIMDTLVFPSEMAEKLIENPLTDNQEQSEVFIKSYLERYYEFQHGYQMLLSEYPEAIEQAILTGEFDFEQTYPEALQQALGGMRKQNIYPTFIKQWSTIIPMFQKNEISEQMRASLHEDLGGYLTLLESTPFVIHPDLAYSYDESIAYLLDMERTLLVSGVEENFHTMLNYTYQELLSTLLGGSDLLEQDGTVKKEVQSAWEKIASNEELTPSAIITQKIIREMESTNWTASDTQKRLTGHHISHALTLAKEGRLQDFELAGIIRTGQDLDIVSLPDAQFEREVQATYERFSSEYDWTILREVHPLVIFSMYVLANDREDPEMMWHLYQPSHESQTWEEYINGWEKEKFNFTHVNHLKFQKYELHSGSIEMEGDNYISFGASMERDQENIWRINYFHFDASIFE